MVGQEVYVLKTGISTRKGDKKVQTIDFFIPSSYII